MIFATARTAFVDSEQVLVTDSEALYEQYKQEFESWDRITAYTSAVSIAIGILSIPCYVLDLSALPVIQFFLSPFKAIVWLRESGIIRIPILLRLSHVPVYFEQWEVRIMMRQFLRCGTYVKSNPFRRHGFFYGQTFDRQRFDFSD